MSSKSAIFPFVFARLSFFLQYLLSFLISIELISDFGSEGTESQEVERLYLKKLNFTIGKNSK